MSSTPASGPRTESLLSRELVLVSLTLLLGAQVPNMFVLAPRFLRACAFDEQQIGIAMGAMNLASLLGMACLGAVLARVGHGRAIAGGALLCALGALGFELNRRGGGGLAGYTAARALLGFGFAAVLVGSGAYVAERAPAHRLAQALGIAGVLTLCAQAIAPALGEAVVAGAGWSAMFYVAAGCGALAALVALTLPPVAAHPGSAAAALRPTVLVLVATTLAAVGFGAIWTFLADYADQVGIAAITPFFVCYVIAATSTRLFFGRLPDILGKRQVAIPALLLHGVALAALAGLGAHWHLAAIGLAFGLAHGVYYPALQALIVERGANRGRSMMHSNFAFAVGIVIAAYALGPVARELGYPSIYALAAAASAVAAGLVYMA